MRKKSIFIFLFIIFFPVLIAYGNINVDINGEIDSSNQFMFNDGEVRQNKNSFSLKFEGGSEKHHFFTHLSLKSTGLYSADDLTSLQDPEKVIPITVSLEEAYLDLYGFPAKPFDIRAGKQIIVWGTADRINPTSNLCPPDLTEMFEFGEKLGVNAFKLSGYTGPFTITGVFVPFFTPVLLPENFFQFTGLGGNPISATMLLPDDTLGENFQAGLKVNWFLSGYDMSLSYYYGRYTIPVISELEINLASGGIESLEAGFPGLQVVGGDFSGTLWKLGLWGEAGLFIPEKYNLTTKMTPYPDSVEEKGDIYLRYVFGIDYTFQDGLYFNLQFAHGLDYETDKDALNDYFITRIEKGLFYDKFKLLPLTLIFTTGNWNKVDKNFGIAYIPEFQYSPIDNLEIDLGCLLIHGKGDNLLTNLKQEDAVFLKLKLNF